MLEAAAKNDFRSYLKYHLEYHMVYIHASKNDSLIGILENMMRHTAWFRFAYLWYQENFKNAIRVQRKRKRIYIET